MYACSHEEYLSEPADTVTWLLAIQRVEDEVEAEQRRKQEAKAGVVR